MLESICEARGMGMSIVRTAKAHYLHPSTLHEWRAKGNADRAEGKQSIYVEFADRVTCEESRGEQMLLRSAHRGTRTGNPRHVAAGKLALATLAQTRAGRYGAQQRFGHGAAQHEGEAESPPPVPEGRRRLDFSKLTPEKRRLLLELYREASVDEES